MRVFAANPNTATASALAVSAAGGHHVVTFTDRVHDVADALAALLGQSGLIDVPAAATVPDVLGTLRRPGIAHLADRQVLLVSKPSPQVIDGLIAVMDGGSITVRGRDASVERRTRPLVVVAVDGAPSNPARRIRDRTMKVDTGLCCSDELDATRDAVAHARECAAERWAAGGWATNQEVPVEVLLTDSGLASDALDTLNEHMQAGSLTFRGAVLTARIAWTIADLHERPAPTASDVEQSLAFRGIRIR